jgi:outer membrane protein assembly factor BamE (lipoprotein component of BamABCDE complex)
MGRTAYLAAALILVAGWGCAPKQQGAPSDDVAVGIAEVPDESPLAKINIGMSDANVRGILGEPTKQNAYMTGKGWIPFYYGPDTSRTDYVYKGIGRVVFSRNKYSGLLKVIDALYNPSELAD